MRRFASRPGTAESACGHQRHSARQPPRCRPAGVIGDPGLGRHPSLNGAIGSNQASRPRRPGDPHGSSRMSGPLKAVQAASERSLRRYRWTWYLWRACSSMAPPFFYQRDHVRHGNQDFHPVLRQRLGDRELIQVARVIVVDGSPEQPAQITNSR